ncbi:MAG: hypothetical protein J6B29_02030 [Clostridia bacterium]|nr:hypothetical protein [Clostridia bacterium]
MGFGLLFFACFLMYAGAITPLASFTFVIGSALMMYALFKLSEQNKMFFVGFCSSVVMLVLSLIIVVMYVFGASSNVFYKTLVDVQIYLSPAIAIIALIAIAIIAKEVDVKRIQARAIVNIIFVFIYVVFDIISRIVKNAEAMQRVGLVCFIAQIIYTLLLLVNTFNCYMRICYEEDRDMSQESSGIAVFDFLNKLMNKATDKNRKNGPKNKGDK